MEFYINKVNVSKRIHDFGVKIASEVATRSVGITAASLLKRNVVPIGEIA